MGSGIVEWSSLSNFSGSLCGSWWPVRPPLATLRGLLLPAPGDNLYLVSRLPARSVCLSLSPSTSGMELDCQPASPTVGAWFVPGRTCILTPPLKTPAGCWQGSQRPLSTSFGSQPSSLHQPYAISCTAY